jgi:hypothetical protein
MNQALSQAYYGEKRNLNGLKLLINHLMVVLAIAMTFWTKFCA